MFYLVFKANEQAAPGRVMVNDPHGDRPPRTQIQGAYVPFDPVTAVEADNANDACTQVAEAMGVFGSFVAMECEPVTISLRPQRLMGRLGKGDTASSEGAEGS